MKVLLILADGMRPDAIAHLPQVQALMKKATYCMDADTVMPSATLPCHMSLLHSVLPSRHGTTTNTYAPQVRPVRGLFEVLKAAKKNSAFFYDWEQLRDLSRPGCLDFSMFQSPNANAMGFRAADKILKDAAMEYIKNHDVDFTFLYQVDPDGAGHDYGWMTEEYKESVKTVWQTIDDILNQLPEEYTVIITADHGGHDRIHGTDCLEDMKIPLFLLGKDFEPGKQLEKASIMDIAPTIAALLGVEPNPDWEGTCLL